MQDTEVAEIAAQLTSLIGRQITLVTAVAWRQDTFEMPDDEYGVRRTPVNRTTTGVIDRVERSASLITVWFEPRFAGDVWLGTDRHVFLAGQPTDVLTGAHRK